MTARRQSPVIAMRDSMADDSKRAGNETLIAVVLALAVFAVYRPVAFYQFNNYDDAQYITDNPHVQGGITFSALKWAFTSGYASNWHPLTWISHELDCQLFGRDAGGHHLINVVFHALNTLLLFAWLKKWTRELWPSLLVAALFAWHPMHVESVAWVAERKDVLSAFFGLLTLGAYGIFAGKPGWGSYGVVCFYYALGLMSKPMLVSLPLILLLLDFWPLRRIAGCELLLPRPERNERGEGLGEGKSLKMLCLRWLNILKGSSSPQPSPPSIPREEREEKPDDAITVPQLPWWWLVAEKIPLCALAAASCVVTYLVQQSGGSVDAEHSFGFRLANAMNSYVVYIGKLLWPRRLAVFYPYDHHFSAGRVIADAALLMAITALVCGMARKRPYWFVGWFWFLITLGPVIGLIQVGGQAYADRYTYIPAIGLFIGVAWELRWLTLIRPRSVGPVVVAACATLAGCILVTDTQLGYWENSITLFSHAIDVAPDSAVAHSNLGQALSDLGREQQALDQFEAALRIEPNHEAALNNKATIIYSRGKTNDAIALFRQLLTYKPDSDLGNNNLGSILFQQGKTAEAVGHFRAAIKSNPEYASAHANLGLALARAGDTAGAVAEYRTALAIKPIPRAENGLGLVLLGMGRFDEAAQHFAIAVVLQPANADARDNLGAALNGQGRYADAEPQLRAVLRLSPDLAEAHFNLGNSLIGLKQPAAAITEYTEALRLANAAHDPELAGLVQARLRLTPPADK